MSSYIHLLEVVTALLCLVLAMRVYRCYREFYLAPESLALEQEQDVTQEEPITVAQTMTKTEEPVVVKKVASPVSAVVSSAPSDDILSDYIGEFFMDSKASTNIDAFRASASEDVAASAKENVSAAPDFDDNIPILENELDDDSIITVMNDDASQKDNHNVMSEKVVHAMLDEAKLVCAS